MDIRAFRGWRYCQGLGADISKLIAPPYDILTAQDKQQMLAGSEHNIVAVDLPHVPPKELGPEALYDQAAKTLGQWMTSGVLCQDDRPCLYAYEQTFGWAGNTFSRRAILCGIRATELGKDVIPHEHTFAGPKADRLMLSQKTRVQLSPVFGFFNDPAGEATRLLFEAATGQPHQHATLGEVDEKLWAINDEQVISRIAQVLRETPVFIADGHHRYTTQMNYAKALRDSGRIDENHEANFVLFAMVSRSDAGLLVLPTHRLVNGLRADFTVEALSKAAPQFKWQRRSINGFNFRNPDESLAKCGPGSMALIGAKPSELWVAQLTDTQAMKQAAPEELDVWRKLDVSVLHKLLLDKALAPWKTATTAVEYTPNGQHVLAACEAGSAQLGVLLASTPMEAIESIALAGSAMPHKSTYFYPKLSTGMVLKPLE